MRILFVVCCFTSLLVYGSHDDLKRQDVPEEAKKHNALFNVIPLQDAKTGSKISYYQRKEVVSDEHIVTPTISWGDLMHALRTMRTLPLDRKF